MSSENCHAGQGGENDNSATTTSSLKRKCPANPYAVDDALELKCCLDRPVTLYAVDEVLEGKCFLDRPANPYGVAVVVERKERLNPGILDCPICFKRFSPPVYQCRNGHMTCSACLKKLVKKKCRECELPIGDIRCQAIAIERLFDSLQLFCKNADYGCMEMLKTEADANRHEEHCRFQPFPCPSPDCLYRGTHVTLAMHLAESHYARTVVLDNSCEARFKLKSGRKFTLLKDPKEVCPVFLLHCEAHEPLGDVVFCTALRGSSGTHYTLRVDSYFNCNALVGARVIDLRFREREYWKHPYLLLPTSSNFANWPVDVHFVVHSNESIAKDSNDDCFNNSTI